MYRKISKNIINYFQNDEAKILCINGARQVGKSYIIRELGKKYYKNYIEINMADDYNGDKKFINVGSINDFYIQTSVIAGDKLVDKKSTLIFIDEIQIYPKLLTLLKPLMADGKYKIICSGSELGLALSKTTLIPIGSIEEVKMYPMDFEEFLYANGVGSIVIDLMRDSFINKKELDESLHETILKLFKTYLYVGGLPEAVKSFVEKKNVYEVKRIQNMIFNYYKEDASKYDFENKLKIKKIYDIIPSTIENKVKRIHYKMIENIEDVRFSRYVDEFDYLISSAIVMDTKAISEPKFPLIQSSKKNLLKLYYNDVGILTYILYQTNINAILEDKSGVNLGSVYETVCAQELKAHGHDLYYFDRKKEGEVDFLIDDYSNLCVTPIEIKSGSDYRNYRSLPKLLENSNYKINFGYVFSNERKICIDKSIIHMPIYYIMFF